MMNGTIRYHAKQQELLAQQARDLLTQQLSEKNALEVEKMVLDQENQQILAMEQRNASMVTNHQQLVLQRGSRAAHMCIMGFPIVVFGLFVGAVITRWWYNEEKPNQEKLKQEKLKKLTAPVPPKPAPKAASRIVGKGPKRFLKKVVIKKDPPLEPSAPPEPVSSKATNYVHRYAMPGIALLGFVGLFIHTRRIFDAEAPPRDPQLESHPPRQN